MLIDREFNRYWNHRGSDFGLWLTNSLNLGYVNIPKNASSFIKEELLSLGWQFGHYHGHTGTIKLVVLRDPVDRWCSGIAQFYGLYFQDKKRLTDEELKLIFDLVVLDDHTEKQGYFLNQIDTDDCVFFKFGETLNKSLHTFLNQYNINNTFLVRTIPTFSNLPIKSQIKQELISNEKYVKRIQQFYHQDYALINQIKFYEPN